MKKFLSALLSLTMLLALYTSGTHPHWEKAQKQDASADSAPLNHTIKIEEATT